MLTIKENQDLKPFTDLKGFRPAIKHIYLKDNEAIATDAFSLVIFPTSESVPEPMLLSVTTNQAIPDKDEEYPDIKQIIPSDETESVITLNNDYLMKCLSLVKKYAGVKASIKIEIRGNNDPIVIKALHKKLERPIKFIIMPIKI